MSNGSIHPSTIEGIKSLAAQIKRERSVQHSTALDIAAAAAQCANFAHAIRTLPSGERVRRTHCVFLTVYWHDTDTHRIGRETLQLKLSRPILDVCTTSEFRDVRGFGSMRMVAEDHFVADLLAGSQKWARENICKAVRSLRFMEHTSLRPSRDRRAAYPNHNQDSRLPNTDHSTDWYDPETGQFVLVDEPYDGAPDLEKRARWSSVYRWHLAKSKWPGMYFPYRCELYVATIADPRFDFAGLMDRIDAIPAPLTREDWNGESANSHDVFVSPAAKTKQDVRRARSKGTVMAIPTKTTIPYGSMFGGQRRRPAGSMPVSQHVEVGRLIKAVIGSRACPYAAHRRMETVRSRLEDWLALEIGRRGLDGPEFFKVYYHGIDDNDPLRLTASNREGIIGMLDQIASRLRHAYPDCAPLRRELNKLAVSKALAMRVNYSPLS